MATHDYIISNASGAAVRADLNNALAAIATNNSSATEPTTTYAYQWWADTGSSPTVMKLRNAANSAWITLFQLDGEWSNIAFENGTAAAPSIYFKDSGTDTGIYSPGTDQVAITTAGVQQLLVDSYGLNTNGGGVFRGGVSSYAVNGGVINFSSPDTQIRACRSGGNYAGMRFYTQGANSSGVQAERMVITTEGLVGIGTTSVNTTLEVQNSSTPIIRVGDGTRHMELRGGSTTQNAAIGTNYNGSFDIIQNGNAAVTIDTSKRVLVGTSTALGSSNSVTIKGTASNNPSIFFGRNENASGITAGEGLGFLEFGSGDGGIGAQIKGEADGTWSSTADCPSRLVFSTTADGASSPTERLRIRSDGVLVSPVTYAATSATSANVNVDSSGNFTRSTSSAKYKADIESIDDSYSDALLNCRPVWYRSTSNNDNPSWSWWGFIAEEVAEIDPRLVQWKTVEVTYDDNGSAIQTPCDPEPEGVAYDRFVPHLLNLIKRQKEQIEAMEARLSALESA